MICSDVHAKSRYQNEDVLDMEAVGHSTTAPLLTTTVIHVSSSGSILKLGAGTCGLLTGNLLFTRHAQLV